MNKVELFRTCSWYKTGNGVIILHLCFVLKFKISLLQTRVHKWMNSYLRSSRVLNWVPCLRVFRRMLRPPLLTSWWWTPAESHKLFIGSLCLCDVCAKESAMWKCCLSFSYLKIDILWIANHGTKTYFLIKWIVLLIFVS